MAKVDMSTSGSLIAIFTVLCCCDMTKSNLERKVFILISHLCSQFVIEGSQDRNSRQELQAETIESALLACSEMHVQVVA